jgi:hypothetical protein
MASWFERVRSWDIRIWASIGASLLLIAGVMWTIPFTPDATNFTFDTTRRDVTNARMIEMGQPVNGQLVDGSDTDFYRIPPLQSSVQLDLHMANESPRLIPALRVYDSTKNLVIEKSKEYLKKPGANPDCSFLAQSDRTYYVQILSQRNTIGAYALTVSARTP